MISNFFEVFVLSIIQGVSEFLPISSAAHLIIASEIYQFKKQSLLIDISLHLGSLLAILFYFKNEILDFRQNINLFYKLLISSLPLILIGYFLYNGQIWKYKDCLKPFQLLICLYSIYVPKLFLVSRTRFSDHIFSII